MESNLTNTQIARVFAMYWGCSVQVKETFYWEKIKWERGDVIGNYLNTGGIHIAITNTFLRLTPLSAISDEDAIEVAKIFYGIDTHWKREILITDGRRFANQLNMVSTVSDAIFIYQYLIQKGYAVPLFIEVGHPDNGKDAIQLGLALDKTKL